MTPREHATRLIDALDAARRSGKAVHEHELSEAAFEEAIAAEREACAQIADDVAKGNENEAASIGTIGSVIYDTAVDIAVTIRSRGQP